MPAAERLLQMRDAICGLPFHLCLILAIHQRYRRNSNRRAIFSMVCALPTSMMICLSGWVTKINHRGIRKIVSSIRILYVKTACNSSTLCSGHSLLITLTAFSPINKTQINPCCILQNVVNGITKLVRVKKHSNPFC